MTATETLLFEMGTEELPPKALKKLSEAFKENVEKSLKENHLSHNPVELFATPRRIALRIPHLMTQQPTLYVEKKGPSMKAAFDSSGNPTKALLGFAQSCGVSPQDLRQVADEKGEWLVHRYEQMGRNAQNIIPEILQQALKKLPIPKLMRWSDKDTEFVRPVHWILLLLGNTIIDCEILGKKANNISYGHRFHSPNAIKIHRPEEYETLLEKHFVMPNFCKRRDFIRESIQAQAREIQSFIVAEEDLLEEVTSIVEWPSPFLGSFDENFLKVPQEALMSAMKNHQKTFPVVDKNDKLKPYFVGVSNIQSENPSQVVKGNERVIRARLSDAKFFFETDLKHSLEHFSEALKTVVFQAKLGTLHEKALRIATLSAYLAEHLKANKAEAERAGLLCKGDLMSGMVGEFPELQGLMGYYYGLHSMEPEEVCTAIKEHYQPKGANDNVPASLLGAIVAMADKIDTLVGIFGIDQIPTGEKDPFALRRAALGILKIILEKQLDVDVLSLTQKALSLYGDRITNKNTESQVFDFILERLRTYYLEKGITPQVFSAVLAKKPSRPLDFQRRIEAVNHFQHLPQAEALAAANKRVSNILVKENAENIERNIAKEYLKEDAEVTLADLVVSKQKSLQPYFEKGEYGKALTELASLQEPVDSFFDNVMVMAEDKNLRHNRLALLATLRDLFLNVADISVLQ